MCYERDHTYNNYSNRGKMYTKDQRRVPMIPHQGQLHFFTGPSIKAQGPRYTLSFGGHSTIHIAMVIFFSMWANPFWVHQFLELQHPISALSSV